MPPPFRVVASRLGDFRPRQQPYMVRRNYLFELKSAFTFPLAAALAEGTFTGVVASKYFNAGPFLIAVITAAPMFGNILALLWAQLAEDRPKVRFINGLQIGVSICIAAVALTYFIPVRSVTLGNLRLDDYALAGWTFATLIILARIMASGIVTLRSAVWRMNYPRQLRGQIISRINGVYNTVLAGMVLLAAFWLDHYPGAYAIIYPVVALVSLFGVLQYSRIRVRGEGALLRRVRLRPAAPAVDEAIVGGGETIGYERVEAARNGRVGPIRGTLRQMGRSLTLLKTDPVFREYQWWQFMLGASFMMMFPSLIYMVSREMTNPNTQYVLAVIVLQMLPMMTGVVFLQVWAPIFDRTPLFLFRVWLGFVAIIAHLLVLTGALTDQLLIVAAGTFMVGVAMGGGQLAWQLGQNAFATREKVGTYMGLHVMLTGARGMFAPFLGVGIYHGLSRFLDDAILFDVPGGRWLFLGSVILCCIGTAGYMHMARRYGTLGQDDPETPAPARARRTQAA